MSTSSKEPQSSRIYWEARWRGTSLHLVVLRIWALLLLCLISSMACNLCMVMKTKKTREVGNHEKEFFITDITHFVVIKTWTFEKKDVFVKVSTFIHHSSTVMWIPDRRLLMFHSFVPEFFQQNLGARVDILAAAEAFY